MELETVRQAVAKLKADGTRVSVRRVHQITGGSFRDLAHLLQALRSEAVSTPATLEGTDALEQEPAPERSPVPPPAPAMPQIAQRTVGEVRPSPLYPFTPRPVTPPSPPTERPTTLSEALAATQGTWTMRRR